MILIPSPYIFWDLIKASGKSWVRNKSARLGAALAFYSALSLIPLFLSAVTLAAFVWGHENAQNRLIGQMQEVVGDQGAAAIQTILSSTMQRGGRTGLFAGFVGFATLLFGASGVFGELQDSLNIIWQAKPREGSAVIAVIRGRFLSFTMVIGTGFLLLISMLISAGLVAVTSYFDSFMPGIILLMKGINFVIGFGVTSLLFALIFKTVPDTPVSWRCALPGGALTAALFGLGKFGLGLYLAHATIASTYGAAGSLVILLLWVYYSSQILFFGAEFSHVYGDWLKARVAPVHSPPDATQGVPHVGHTPVT